MWTRSLCYKLQFHAFLLHFVTVIGKETHETLVFYFLVSLLRYEEIFVKVLAAKDI